MNCIICDDNENVTNQVKEYVQTYARIKQVPIKCKIYNNSNDLLSDLAKGFTANLYLLDIVMPGLNGIFVAKQIRKKNTECVLIFLTNTSEYTYEAYEVDALQYLNKPITKGRFYRTLDRTLQFLHIDPNNLLPITTKNGLQVLTISEIIFIESNKHILSLYLTTGTLIETKDSAHTITELSNILPSPPFIIPYKGYIVNLTHVSYIDKFHFVTINGSKIPIPSRHYNHIKDIFAEFLLRQMHNTN